MYYGFDIDEKLISIADNVEKEAQEEFLKHDKIAMINSGKVLKSFHDNRLSSSDFVDVTGYGYYDEGRNKLEKIYAQIFKAEDALVRSQIMSGTHALCIALCGLLKYGETFISISGEPYDSLRTVIGLDGDSQNSMIQNGIKYEQIDLLDDDFDYDKIVDRLKFKDVKLVEIQRSRGYSKRKSLSIEKIEKVCKKIRNVNNEVIIMVDNCYGDFVEEKEPIEVGADIIVGSMLKNLGAGNVTSGGYIVGKKDLIWSVSERFSAPGLGKDIGANFNQNINYFRALFLAPSVVSSSVKTMIFASGILEKLNIDVCPKMNEHRTDIVQAVKLNNEKKLVNFCQAIQKGTVVDRFFVPIPSETPGYKHKEIMAGGSFITGSTIELSCDGPVVEPYTAFMQGSLNFEQGKLGILIGINEYLKNS